MSTRHRFAKGTNLLANDSFTVSASTSALSYPALNAIAGIPGFRWHSNHNSIVIISGQNDRLDYDDGSVKVIAITAGAYYPLTLAAQIQSLLGTGWTCSYNETTQKFTIIGPGTFTLKHSSGTNRSRSISKTLGFDCSSDDSGASSYTADYSRTSTWGQIVIDSTNNKLRIAATNLTLTSGTYNIMSYCQMVLHVIDNGVAGADDFDVDWVESTKKFRVKRHGSGTTIEWSDGTNTTCRNEMGYAASDDSPAAGSYADADTVCIHGTCGETLDIDRASTSPGELDFIGIGGHNTSASGTTTVIVSVNSNYSSPAHSQALTYNSGGIMYEFTVTPSETDHRYFRVKIVDQTNTDGYVSIGGLHGSDFFELSRNAQAYWTKGKVAYESMAANSYGNRRGARRTNSKMFGMELKHLDLTDETNIEALLDACGCYKPAMIVLDLDNAPLTFSGAFYMYAGARPRDRETTKTGTKVGYSFDLEAAS